MEIRLLGSVEVRDGPRTFTLPRRQQRALLAALALRAGEVVSKDKLITDLWGEKAPASASGSLQNTVSALRQLLGTALIETQAPGYRLAVSPDGLDVNRFEWLLADARAAEPATRTRLLREALELWRGPALADLVDLEFARFEAARLDERRLQAQEERITAELELGLHAGLVGELEQLVATHPLRERLRAQLMLALYRCGRQAEALEVYRAARLALADELGLDPSPELQELERKVLRQDPELAAPEERAPEAARAAAERKLVSVLYVTPPAEDDAERLRRRLDGLLASARKVLARHGGVLERFGPEGLVAVFGAESARDDDALAAVRAAAELGLPAGVATGESVEGAGAVFVRASELARGTGLQVDERTRALVRYQRRLDAPLVGRAEELDELLKAFHETGAHGRCRVVSVVGEPGIGKTRLGRALVSALGDDAVTLLGRCVSYGGGSTFLPLLPALSELDLAATMSTEPDGELAVRRLAALGTTDRGTIGESYWALRRLLETLARDRPVVLLLDDVHWAEPALLDLVDYLAERITAAPVLVVCLSRPELERIPGDQLVLGPLSDAEARAFVAGVVALDEETQERIVGLAEGNPLYAEQLASFAAEGGEGLPPTLEAVLAGRLGRLDESERAALQRAAVIGREFSRSTLVALADEPVDVALASLSRRGFLHAAATPDPADDGYRFHHALLRDAVYESLTKLDRAVVHERAASWLDGGGAGDDALVGYHLEQSALLRRQLGADAGALAESAGERLGDAAMHAWRQNDTLAAIGLLRRATALLPAGERRAELLCELALAELNAGERGDALARAAEDARVAGSRRVAARIAVERASREFRAGDTSAVELLDTALGSIDVLTAAGDDRALGRVWLAVSDAHQWACRYEDAAEAARTASESYARASFSPAVIHAALAYSLLFGPAPVRDAIAECELLREAASDQLSEANVCTMLGVLAAFEERFEEARALLEHTRQVYEDLGSVRTANVLWRTCATLVERRAGDLDAAATLARATLRYFEEQEDPAYGSTWAARLGELLYWDGRHEESARAVAAAREGAVAHDVYVQFLWRSTAAKLAARDGRADEADRLSEEALQLAAASDSPLLVADLWTARAEVLRLGGRRTEAAAAARRARTLLRQKGDSAGLAEIGRLLGRGQTKSPSGLSV